MSQGSSCAPARFAGGLKLGLVAALAFAAVAAMAQPTDASAVLADLARSLADARGNSAKPRAVRCPPNTGALAGLSLGQILVELGQPDSNAKDSVTYSFGRSGSSEQGALTFRFNAQGVVSAVDCRPK